MHLYAASRLPNSSHSFVWRTCDVATNHATVTAGCVSRLRYAMHLAHTYTANSVGYKYCSCSRSRGVNKNICQPKIKKRRRAASNLKG